VVIEGKTFAIKDQLKEARCGYGGGMLAASLTSTFVVGTRTSSCGGCLSKASRTRDGCSSAQACRCGATFQGRLSAVLQHRAPSGGEGGGGGGGGRAFSGPVTIPAPTNVIPLDVRRLPPPREPQSKFEEILARELNVDQRAAVLAPLQSQICVTSGPGSGKTRILTYRQVFLVQELRVDPASMLAVTFTVKAANEMKERLYEMLGDVAGSLLVGTFHSVCNRMLHMYGAKNAVVPQDFSVLDQSGAGAWVKRIVEMRQEDPTLKGVELDPKTLLGKFGDHKNEVGYESRSLERGDEKKWRGQLDEAFGATRPLCASAACSISRICCTRGCAWPQCVRRCKSSPTCRWTDIKTATGCS
jgi:hypothetical protein